MMKIDPKRRPLGPPAETGCAYFITHDKRILRKREELKSARPPTLQIGTLEELFDVLDAYENGRM